MSSKATSDPLLFKAKKKDKDRKETKQEKKERKEREKKEKKEKKEKSRKREKDMTNDVGVENQESPSAKRKKKFGGFRLRGKKTKHSSLGSLKQEDRSGSEFSFQDPSGSMDSALAEKAEPSEKVVLNLRKGSAKATLAVLAESSDVVQPDVTDNRGIDKTGAEMADGREPLPKEHSVDAELQKIEEPANIQEQDKSVENMQVQSLELKPRSFVQVSAIIPEPSEDRDDSSTKREKEDQKESVTLTLQENVSSRGEQASHVVSQVAMEDVENVHGPEITSSDDESMDTVVSTGISDTGDVTGKIEDEVKIGTFNQGEVENSIISTYRERNGAPQDESQHDQEEAPDNTEAMLLVHPDKQQVQEQTAQQDDPVNEEIPVMPAISNIQESAIPMLEEDASSGFVEETKHDVSLESAHDSEVALEDIKTAHDREIKDNDEFEPLKQEDMPEPIISTYEERKVQAQDDQQVKEETPLNEEKQQVQNQRDGRENDPAEEEFVNHVDAGIKERPKHEGENHTEPIVYREEEKRKQRSAISLCCACLGY